MKHHPIGLFIISLPNSSVDVLFFSDELLESPSTSVVAINVDAVREMIERDRHITYREFQASLGIDMKAIHTILHDHLNVRKLCSYCNGSHTI